MSTGTSTTPVRLTVEVAGGSWYHHSSRHTALRTERGTSTRCLSIKSCYGREYTVTRGATTDARPRASGVQTLLDVCAEAVRTIGRRPNKSYKGVHKARSPAWTLTGTEQRSTWRSTQFDSDRHTIYCNSGSDTPTCVRVGGGRVIMKS